MGITKKVILHRTIKGAKLCMTTMVLFLQTNPNTASPLETASPLTDHSVKPYRVACPSKPHKDKSHGAAHWPSSWGWTAFLAPWPESSPWGYCAQSTPDPTLCPDPSTPAQFLPSSLDPCLGLLTSSFTGLVV